MNSIRLKIVTPEKVVYQAEIEQITLPTTEGQITVLPHHVPLMSLLMAGEMVIKKDGQSVPMAVSSGFVQVHDNEVVVLADTAERAEDIDLARAEAAQERALRLMREVKNTEDVNYTALAAKMEKELARLRVVRKHRTHHAPPIGQ